MQPIRIHESYCIFYSIFSNVPIMCFMFVRLIVLATVFSMAWCKVVIQRSLVVNLTTIHR